MKPRARRITMGMAILVAIIVALLAVGNWVTVRDHIEAWHLQLTRETQTFEPLAEEVTRVPLADEVFLRATARQLEHPVIFAPPDISTFERMRRLVTFTGHINFKTMLEMRGYRLIEQLFPRRAYVVVRAGPNAGLLWDASVFSYEPDK